MRRAVAYLAILWLLALAFASVAKGDGGPTRPDPFPTDLRYAQLDRVASRWAARPVAVECPVDQQSWTDDPDAEGTWGYTYLDADWTRIQPDLCAGALNLDAPDEWHTAISILVITHESWHLRQWAWRADEARVECKAIKSFQASARMLGADETQVASLYSWAWAFHVREGTLFPSYALKGCNPPKPRPSEFPRART